MPVLTRILPCLQMREKRWLLLPHQKNHPLRLYPHRNRLRKTQVRVWVKPILLLSKTPQLKSHRRRHHYRHPTLHQ